MYSDIVFPDSNEEGFIEIAKALGYSKLYFIYPYSRFASIKTVKQSDVKVELGILSDAKGLNSAKQLSRFVAFRGSDRSIIEHGSASLIFDLEDVPEKDSLHYRSSGFNHVLARLANESGIAIGFSFSSILNSQNRSRTMGRISQNIMLCRKYKVRMRIASFAKDPYEMRSPHDLMALFSLLGMHPKDAKDAMG